MGAWAEGNFDNDTALDLVAYVADNVAKEMSPPSQAEDIDLVMAAVAVRKALVEHCYAPPPKRSEIQTLKEVVLSVFDEQIDSLKPTPQYKANRRRTIADTFDKFLRLLTT